MTSIHYPQPLVRQLGLHVNKSAIAVIPSTDVNFCTEPKKKKAFY